MRPKPPPHYRILIMMATNMPSALDEALLRPGRIDRMYRVGYPSKAGRIRTYEGYFNKVQHELTAENLDKLATITPYATGATIKDLVNEALLTAIRNGRDVITWPDVIKAKQLRNSGRPRTSSTSSGSGTRSRSTRPATRWSPTGPGSTWRSTSPRSRRAATTSAWSPRSSRRTSSPGGAAEYEADILVALASLAGERMFFANDSSSGVSGDLDSATTVASYMEGYWGMGKTVSSASASRRLEGSTPGGGRSNAAPVGDRGSMPGVQRLADRIEDNLGVLLIQAEGILRENERYVLALAHALETHKTLTGEDVTAVFDGGRGPVVNGDPYLDDGFIAPAARVPPGGRAGAPRAQSAAPADAGAHAGPGICHHLRRERVGFRGRRRRVRRRQRHERVERVQRERVQRVQRERVLFGTLRGTDLRPAHTRHARYTRHVRRIRRRVLSSAVRPRHRVRLAVNLLNGSTLAGLAIAGLGGARLTRCPDGLLTGTGYRLPVPAAPAFTMGNVIITRRPALDAEGSLFQHEARHSTQYAWCGGLLMLPLYFSAAGASWLLSDDFGAWNVFERGAGLADGGYTARPLRRSRASAARHQARIRDFT